MWDTYTLGLGFKHWLDYGYPQQFLLRKRWKHESGPSKSSSSCGRTYECLAVITSLQFLVVIIFLLRWRGGRQNHFFFIEIKKVLLVNKHHLVELIADPKSSLNLK